MLREEILQECPSQPFNFLFSRSFLLKFFLAADLHSGAFKESGLWCILYVHGARSWWENRSDLNYFSIGGSKEVYLLYLCQTLISMWPVTSFTVCSYSTCYFSGPHARPPSPGWLTAHTLPTQQFSILSCRGFAAFAHMTYVDTFKSNIQLKC